MKLLHWKTKMRQHFIFFRAYLLLVCLASKTAGKFQRNNVIPSSWRYDIDGMMALHTLTFSCYSIIECSNFDSSKSIYYLWMIILGEWKCNGAYFSDCRASEFKKFHASRLFLTIKCKFICKIYQHICLLSVSQSSSQCYIPNFSSSLESFCLWVSRRLWSYSKWRLIFVLYLGLGLGLGGGGGGVLIE